MSMRAVMPVRLDLALAMDREGDLLAAAARLAALNDPALRPLAALLLDMLGPLLGMGAMTGDTRRRIDGEVLGQFYLGILAGDEDRFNRMTLAGLAAALAGWRACHGPAPVVAAPDAALLESLMQRHPDHKETPSP